MERSIIILLRGLNAFAASESMIFEKVKLNKADEKPGIHVTALNLVLLILEALF